MGSPVSIVVAEIIMQLTNEQCHSGYVTSTTLLQSYTKTKSKIFTNSLRDGTPTIQFTKEIEENGKMVRLLGYP